MLAGLDRLECEAARRGHVPPDPFDLLALQRVAIRLR
jgi:hypothetical protein